MEVVDLHCISDIEFSKFSVAIARTAPSNQTTEFLNSVLRLVHTVDALQLRRWENLENAVKFT